MFNLKFIFMKAKILLTFFISLLLMLNISSQGYITPYPGPKPGPYPEPIPQPIPEPTPITPGIVATLNDNLSQLESFPISTDGLIKYFHFDNYTVINNQKSTAAVNYGAEVYGSGITSVSDRGGNANQALSFDHTNASYVKINGVSNFSNSYTIAFWVKILQTDYPETWGTIISKRLDLVEGIEVYKSSQAVRYNSYTVSVNSNGNLYAGGNTTNSVNTDVISGINSYVNKWMHLALVYDGDSLKLYFDGEKKDAKLMTGSVMFNESMPLVLGQISDKGLTQGGSFVIDDLAIFSRALTKNETKSLANYVGVNLPEVTDDIAVVYPNPVKDVLHFSGYGELYNSLGKLVISGTGSLEVKQLPNGFYFLILDNKTLKIVKQ